MTDERPTTGRDARRPEAVGALRAALALTGVELGPGDGLALGHGRSATLQELVGAGLRPEVVHVVARRAAVGSAARALLDGTVTSDDVWWALAHGWHEGGRRVLVQTTGGQLFYRHEPTPERDLDRLLATLVALRPLARAGRPRHPADLGWSTDRSVARMGMQAVRRLRSDAAVWVGAWAAAGNTIEQAHLFLPWLDSYAVPWRRARPPGHDPAAWALGVALWHAAGYTADEAGRLAALPVGHPDRPGPDQLSVMAALRGS